MKYRRGAIVEACFLMPDNNKTLNHPAIVLSNEDMYNVDGCYLVVMITHYSVEDMFTFKLDSSMFEGNYNESDTQARCHLITYIRESDIITNRHSNRVIMKRNQVNRLVEFISEVTMGEG